MKETENMMSQSGRVLSVGCGIAVALLAFPDLLWPQDVGPRTEAGGGVSYCPPKGWTVVEIPGAKFKAVHGASLKDFAPNIQINDELYEDNERTLADRIKGKISSISRMFADSFRNLGQATFLTNAGEKGVKVVIKFKLEGGVLEGKTLRQTYFFFDTSEGDALVVTCSCLADEGEAYDALFEKSLKTLCVKSWNTNKTEKTIADKREGGEAIMNKFSVSEQNQAVLLGIARQSMEQVLKTGKRKTFDVTDPELTAPAAVFVTLTQQGQLRGCIGTTEPRSPLYQAVSELAVAAAVEDHRFDPLTLGELAKTHIEISVLSPLTRIKSPDEIQQRVHGVVVRRGMRGGLFLPQVWEHFATKEDFMNELCMQKAGLDPSAWKDPKTELYIFTVFAFEEKKDEKPLAE